ncbi:putative short-chain dehydrogenase oxidoreductase protein [Phaeoacremonium minimum UCRPA7]|uniref:Putative short-chain dehydrogenase oxidoreductase protein n=1 Tax=Phaeoacremonium minimum (strain UCR-PA7) TaxID=1286976 RepID=R8BXV8_PHAM7|nr:putative short-chain dehydrogenase oxidoreductase protein [Phaeoacremonium minimum UCRPA7]EOO04177.1 putative short-chain dehydrogenase oxidoreductase protein [Phaeoacremonium minimum UCRPA7]
MLLYPGGTARTVLITGATAGIGQALAERMIENGIFVIAVGRRKDRLEALLAKYGTDKIAIEPFDVSDVEAIPTWAKEVTTKYPDLSSIFLNAGIQRTIDFTHPEAISLDRVNTELTTNYTSPLHTLVAFLPHLTSLEPRPASIVLVSSGLALIPIPRCANYCATKAAMHSLAWTLRSQLSAPSSPETQHIRIIEIIPPAVQTELHTQQPDLAAAGQGPIGMPLQEFLEETWSALEKGDEDEILVGPNRERWGTVENEKKAGFKMVEGIARKGTVAP